METTRSSSVQAHMWPRVGAFNVAWSPRDAQYVVERDSETWVRPTREAREPRGETRERAVRLCAILNALYGRGVDGPRLIAAMMAFSVNNPTSEAP